MGFGSMKKNRMSRENRWGPRRRKPMIREVWAWNFESEISRFDRCLESYTILSIDTEFPGFIQTTPWGSIDEQIYQNMRVNVNQTKLIQLGLTASDECGKIGGAWEFNFCDFDAETDAHNPSSISFLKQNGLDFDRLKSDGIPLVTFTANFVQILRKNQIFRWVTFHGLYDIGYLVKAMGVVQELPESMEEFGNLVVNAVGSVRDLKHIARFCEGLEDGKLGLERLGELLEQKRLGSKHHAGSDSLLTAALHTKIMERFEPGSEICDGFLYGLSNKLQNMEMMKMKAVQTITFGRIPVSIPVYYFPCYYY